MTLDVFLQLLRCHRAAMQSSLWSLEASSSVRPALYLNEAETEAVIAELTRLLTEVAGLRASLGGTQVADRSREFTRPCMRCGSHGWLCRQHPDQAFPHAVMTTAGTSTCAGPRMPCGCEIGARVVAALDATYRNA